MAEVTAFISALGKIKADKILLKSIRGNKRALSPIFATLIILGVVTVLFIPVFIWASGMTSSSQESWETSGQSVTERIIIEETSLKNGETSCIVYVRNIGKTAVSIDNVFVSLADGSGTVHAYDTVLADKTYAIQGDLITVTIEDLGFNPIDNVAYSITVYTTRGVADTYQVVA